MTPKVNRREVLIGGGKLVLAGITLGTLNVFEPLVSASQEALAAGGSMAKTAGFGWEISNINNNGADVYFQVNTAITLNSIDIDISLAITSAPSGTGIAEVLCTASISRGGPPPFVSGSQGYLNLTTSPDFGGVQVYSPAGAGVNYNPNLGQDAIYAVMARAFVPSSGSGAYTSRHVTSPLNVTANAGDYLAFHMDHAGIQVDTEMQIVINYQ